MGERLSSHDALRDLIESGAGQDAILAALEDYRKDVDSDIRVLQRQERKTEIELENLHQETLSDPLTKIANRRGLDARSAQEFARCRRSGEPIAAIMIDIDHFKSYNDSLGHLAGDDCLKAVAGVMNDACRRGGDFVARFGGEEFTVLLPGKDQSDAMALANRIRDSLANLDLHHPGTELGRVTASFGISACDPNERGVTPGDLFADADGALYLSKRSGRDRVEVSVRCQNRDYALTPDRFALDRETAPIEERAYSPAYKDPYMTEHQPLTDFSEDPKLVAHDLYARDGFVEYVPTVWLLQFMRPGWKLEHAQEVAESTADGGYLESLILQVGQKDRQVNLGEGRHRLMAAVINGRSHVPVRISRSMELGDGLVCRHMSRVPTDAYFSADSSPSRVFDPSFIPKSRFVRGRRFDLDRKLGDTRLALEREPQGSRDL